MKKSMFLVCAFALAAFACTSCGSSKKTASVTPDEVEVAIPLDGPEYQSDANYWRATASGVSNNMEIAKKVAVQNARQELAGMVKSQLKQVIDNYTNNIEADGVAAGTNLYESQAYTVVDQELTGVEQVGQKMFKQADGSYRYHVCLQMSKQAVEEKVSDALAEDAKLGAMFDRSQFKKTYEEQMAAYQASKK